MTPLVTFSCCVFLVSLVPVSRLIAPPYISTPTITPPSEPPYTRILHALRRLIPTATMIMTSIIIPFVSRPVSLR